MESMVERVAKALWDSEPDIYGWGPQERRTVSWDDAVKSGLVGVTIFRAFARADIEAMREPTDRMATGAQATGMGLVTPEALKEMFRAMIDAALSPTKEVENG